PVTEEPAGSGRVGTTMTVNPDTIRPLLGTADRNLRVLEEGLGADIHVIGNDVTLSGTGPEVELAQQAVAELARISRAGQQITPETVERTVGMLTDGAPESPAEVLSLDILS